MVPAGSAAKAITAIATATAVATLTSLVRRLPPIAASARVRSDSRARSLPARFENVAPQTLQYLAPDSPSAPQRAQYTAPEYPIAAGSHRVQFRPAIRSARPPEPSEDRSPTAKPSCDEARRRAEELLQFSS